MSGTVQRTDTDMKTTAFLLLFSASLTLGDLPAYAFNNVPAETETDGFKRRKKRFRQKKGFMWGLFKKKDCGCPKF